LVKQRLPVFWAPVARDRLKAIYQYYKSVSHQGAEAVRKDVLNAAAKIPAFPEKHQTDPDLGPPYRRVVTRHYHIVYLVKAEGVFIVDVFDARQSPGKKQE
jgi:toxin ParE1/3/4